MPVVICRAVKSTVVVSRSAQPRLLQCSVTRLGELPQ